MKRLGVFLLPPGWDASPSQGYPQHFAGTHLYTWVEGERHSESKSVLPKNTTQCTQPGPKPGPLDLESSTLTMRPSLNYTIFSKDETQHDKTNQKAENQANPFSRVALWLVLIWFRCRLSFVSFFISTLIKRG